MKIFSFFFFNAILLTTVIGCGKTPEEKAKEDFKKFTSQYKSGACGLDVVSDYNSVVLECGSYSNSNCDSMVNTFIAKYPGINCIAEKGYGLNKTQFTVTEEAVRNLSN